MGFIQCVASWLIPWFRASAGGEQAMGTSSAQPRSTHCLPACSSGAGLWQVRGTPDSLLTLCGSELGSLTVLLKIPSNALVCLKGKAPESVSRGFVRHCWPLPFPVGTQLLVLPFAGLGARRWALLSPGLSASRPAGLQQEEAASEVLPLGCLSQSKHVEPWDLSGALGALGHEQKMLHLIHQP